jgi:hypothetical protein
MNVSDLSQEQQQTTQTFCCWGDLRSLQDCVCTHIERDLECSSGGKKKGLEIYFSLFPLPHLSLSLSEFFHSLTLNPLSLSLSFITSNNNCPIF